MNRFASKKRLPAFPLRSVSLILLGSLGLPALLLCGALAKGDENAPHPPTVEQTRFQQQVQPLLQQYCLSCHGMDNPRAGLNLSGYHDIASLQKDQGVWRKALGRIRDGSMPPPGAPHPSADQRDKLTLWLTATLNNADPSLLPHNPGRVLIHRLSRMEYNNTVRDLFGVTSKPADKFPADGGGGAGFDNNADTLFVPPILMERYLAAAGDILEEANPSLLFVARPGKTLTKRAAAREIVSYQAMRAFRRPAETAEVDRLMRLFDQASQRGESFENAVKFTLKGALVSPNFLFRAEAERKGNAYPINDYELASRLSYFLWASMPDDELFRLAAQKRLHEPAVLEQQALRMLKSRKSHALADSFAGQWLHVRDLFTTVQPDPNRFPNYTPALRDAMYGEAIELFNSVLQDNSSLLTLLNADYTYVNEELAKHYGIPGIQGAELRRVAVADGKRGGALTLAGVLTLTSFPQRTSPVLRGKWVLEEIFGTPSPPPPPVVGTLPADDRPANGLTFRQRLEKHREKPQCAGCHSRMDPLGFGLENYDAVGRWRAEISGQPVDASGVLVTGEKFSGPVELKQHVLERKDDFVRNLTEKMLAYALGRGLEPYDLPAVKKITTALEKDGYKSSTLIREIVKSYPFQYRKGG